MKNKNMFANKAMMKRAIKDSFLKLFEIPNCVRENFTTNKDNYQPKFSL